jgi:hypothetical protein
MVRDYCFIVAEMLLDIMLHSHAIFVYHLVITVINQFNPGHFWMFLSENVAAKERLDSTGKDKFNIRPQNPCLGSIEGRRKAARRRSSR